MVIFFFIRQSLKDEYQSSLMNGIYWRNELHKKQYKSAHILSLSTLQH